LQRGPCRVVILVDTSKSMSSRWPELAHQYIPALLDALPNAKEDGSDVSVSIVPIRDGHDQLPNCARFLDKHTQIHNLRTAQLGPEVSENAIWRGYERGINLLSQPGDTSMKYLIVALTSFPGSAGAEGGSSSMSSVHAPWEGFAQRLVKYDIRMTIIMEPVRSYKTVNDFFKSVLTQQRRQFTSPWFAYNARLHHFLISGFSKRSIIRERSKGGSTGTAPSGGMRGRLDPLSMSSSSSSQRSPVDLSDITIDKGSRRLGLVEELRRRTGFWPAGADVPSGSSGEGSSSKSRSSASVRGTAQQRKQRSKDRDERDSPESGSGAASSPLQEFPAFSPPGTSLASGPSSSMTTQSYERAGYDWNRAQAGSLPSTSPLGHGPAATSHGHGLGGSMSNQQGSGYSNMHAATFSPLYQPPANIIPQYNQPSAYPPTSPIQTPNPYQGSGSSMYYGPTPSVPHSSSSRSPYRPLSPSHNRPSSSSGYRTVPIQDPNLHHNSGGSYGWHPSGQVPPQYLSRLEDSSLYGWDGKK